MLVSLCACDGFILPYSIDIYDKNNMSKIDMTQSLIMFILKPKNKGFVMRDNWYSSKAFLNSSLKAGFSYIGALKIKRVVYTEEYSKLGIKLHKFANSLNIQDYVLITVNSQEYNIYNYVGSLKDRKKVSIVLSYQKDSFQKEDALKILFL